MGLFTFLNIFEIYGYTMCYTSATSAKPGAYAGFLKAGTILKIFGILGIHAAKRHVASRSCEPLLWGFGSPPPP